MERTEETIMRMFSFSWKVSNSEFQEMTLQFGEIWKVVEDIAFNLISTEQLSVPQWDLIEGLDNWLHDTHHAEWATYQENGE